MRKFVLIVGLALSVSAQTPPADDKPSVKVGGMIFADYTLQPEGVDAFNIGRAQFNVTGNLNRWITFRLTPDIARESGSGSSLAGSYTFRLKYAYAQFNLDQWMAKGTWVRFGMQQTPYLEFTEGAYRYRFQGTLFPERVLSFFTVSDTGITMRYPLPGDRGDIHGGFYNGEGYTRAEQNDQKAFQLRATYIPIKGLKLTAFVIEDHYASDSKRERFLGQISYQHPRYTLGLELLRATDQTVRSKGWSAWAMPKLGSKGWELLLRHDDYEETERNIAGIAYWLPNLDKVTAAAMLDYDSLRQPTGADDTRYGLKLLISF
ncbi:MAG TPA: porin [Thermoanaerobaculia bacterium]|nr:porin [Thermoanaerobaculia bacterium]